MCAALNRAGHVDACVSKDCDALLFGAQTLFQTIKPVVRGPWVLAVPDLPFTEPHQSHRIWEVGLFLGLNQPGNLGYVFCLAHDNAEQGLPVWHWL